ncbi:MAG: hypothetical protein WBW33_23530 [Bryobacteraceae bacterium]
MERQMRRFGWWLPATAAMIFGVTVTFVIPGSGASDNTASIAVDAARPIGTVSDNLFGQNLEYEHGTFSGGEQNINHEHGLHAGGLWAEMLRDRKFEEGDLDRDGVANGWVPEERVANRYEELVDGRGINDRYRIDTTEYYGGGASQAIEVFGDGSNHASIYQVSLHFSKGRRYNFYVYLKRGGTGTASVEFSSLGTGPYASAEFSPLADSWAKYTASFTAPEDTVEGRVRILVKGNGIFWIDSASLMPADNLQGIRADVVDAIKPLKVFHCPIPWGLFRGHLSLEGWCRRSRPAA